MITPDRVQRVQTAAAKLLREQWDPKGLLATQPPGSHSYDIYTSQVLAIVEAGGTAADVADYLFVESAIYDDTDDARHSRDELVPLAEALLELARRLYAP